MTLFTLRLELENINHQLISLIGERKSLAEKIQKTKNEAGKSTFDPEREADLFFSMEDELSKLSIKELQAFSLLMEDHAGPGYPAWSEGEHLAKPGAGTVLNPLLLLIFHPDKIKVDALKEEYQSLFKLVEERR